jgi:hypothetical protein
MHATARSLGVLALWAAASSASYAQLGASTSTAPDWPKWQARLGVTTTPQLGAPRGSATAISLLGDYYFTGPGFGAGRVGGGLRATSGLYVGDTGGSAPYLGVGYTGASLRGGWGFTADIGLKGLSATSSSGLRLGRAPAPAIDDTLRDLRLAPTLQLGVTYRF